MTSMVTQVRKLSHKAFRALLKKFRRKKKRQTLAIARDNELLLEQQKRENSPNFEEHEAERRRNEGLWEEYQERERTRKHKEWLYREAVAQKEFQRKRKMQEEEEAKREELRIKMLAELEEQSAIQLATDEQKKQKQNTKEAVLQATLSGLPEVDDSPWHKPLAPKSYTLALESHQEPKDKEQCQFFAKTGCCRFGDRCSRGHIYPEVSTTILIRGMYSHFSIEQSNRDDYDTDMALEFDEGEMYQDFRNFYEDVVPEFRKCGKMLQFLVCNNHESHLRGNIYVQYTRNEEAIAAFQKFNGRFYAGKQLSCEFTNIIKWKSAICGLYYRNKCPKGNNCNFLHVFRNPNDEFREANFDHNSYWHWGRQTQRHPSSRSHRSDIRSSYSSRSYSSRSRRSRSSERRSRTKERHLASSGDDDDDFREKYSDKKKPRHRSRSKSDDSSPRSSKSKRHRKHKKSKKKKKSSKSGSDISD